MVLNGTSNWFVNYIAGENSMKHIERIWYQFLARFTRLEKLEDIAGNYAEISAIYQREYNRRKSFIEISSSFKNYKGSK